MTARNARALDVRALPAMLTALRLPSIHRHWPALAERADSEGWPAARFLATLASSNSPSARPGGSAATSSSPNCPAETGVIKLSELDGRNGFRIDGVDRIERGGFALSYAGDVNGDGIDDLIAGAPDAGESYVVFGAPTNAPMETSPVPGFRLQTYAPGAWYSGVETADLDGDGRAEVIVGRRGYDALAVEIWGFDGPDGALRLRDSIPVRVEPHDVEAGDFDHDRGGDGAQAQRADRRRPRRCGHAGRFSMTVTPGSPSK